MAGTRDNVTCNTSHHSSPFAQSQSRSCIADTRRVQDDNMQQHGGKLQQKRTTTSFPLFHPEHTLTVHGIIHIPQKSGPDSLAP
jgi:hypothetical protein